jgi:8-oxo-dGTP pyrophosphatase MutT (NUDIX family)
MVVQPACDTELLLLSDWRNYLDELVSTEKIISFATKSEINGADLQFLREINEILMTNGKVLHIGITIVRLRDWKELEPRAPSPSARIATLRRLWEAGIPTIVVIRPMMPMVTPDEIEELVEKTHRFCHGYLSGPLYLTPAMEEYVRCRNISFTVTERIAAWQEEQPRLRIVECADLEEYLRKAAESKGRRLFNNNVEAAVYCNDVLNQKWTDDMLWLPNVRREPVGTVYVIDPNTKEFLLMFHRKLGKWLPPGGHQEGKENTTQTALREAKEELDIDLHLMEINGKLNEDGEHFRRVPSDPESCTFCTIEEIIQPIGAQDPHIHVDSIYVGTITSKKQPAKRDKGEVTATDWFSLSQIEQLNTFDNVPVICRAILQAIERQQNLKGDKCT